MKILVTCPPMLRSFDEFREEFEHRGWTATLPHVAQTLSVEQLLEVVPAHEGWIIGDDPATTEVFAAGRKGRLRAAVKWGVGVDNVDRDGALAAGVPVSNTPGMFGREVADVAMAYLVMLARQLHIIDRGVWQNEWPKPAGMSLAGKTAALVGFGDIGRQIARRLLVAEMNVVAYDPFYQPTTGLDAVQAAKWPDRLEEAHFVILACALTPENRHLVGRESLARCRDGVRVVNVSRGALVDERALAEALATGRVAAAALEVMEHEPLPASSPLREHSNCIFGSHNASNTLEAVRRTSRAAIGLLADALAKAGFEQS